jgi:hypothetical protein
MKSPLSKDQRTLEWSHEQAIEWRRPEPYNRTVGPILMELDSPDEATSYLLIFGKLEENSGLFTYYGIEAPRNCPMRAAFEWGEMEWEDYWTHKGVLYEITMPFNPGPAVGRPIKPSDLPQNTLSRFRQLGNDYPYELKRRALALSLRIAIKQNTDIENNQHAYDDFMKRFGHRFTKKSA